LCPASPPGFVAALTTARSRDAPAEYSINVYLVNSPALLLLLGSSGAWDLLLLADPLVPAYLYVSYRPRVRFSLRSS
jgi:hypothetical protein